MKPVVLFITDNFKCDKKNYRFYDINFFDLAKLGLGKSVETKEEFIDNNISTLSSNDKLVNCIQKVKISKTKVHIIGDLNSDTNTLDELIKVFKNNKITPYIHAIGEAHGYNVCEYINSLDIDVYGYLTKGKKNKSINVIKAKRIMPKDVVIFFNSRISKYGKLVKSLSKSNDVLTIFDSNNSIFKYPNYVTLSECISNNNLKELRYKIDNYSFDGYKDIKLKNVTNASRIDNIQFDNYDFVIANVTEDELSNIEIPSDALIISKNDNLIYTTLKMHKGNITNVAATILELLNINVPDTMDSSLIEKDESSKAVAIFEIISILFIISCVVFYMTRLLHFYLVK